MSTRSQLIHLAASVDVEAVSRYLTSRGWKMGTPKEGRLLRFEGPQGDSGRPVVAVIPSSPEFEDYSRRMSELVVLVGTIENRPPEEVLREMSGGSAAALDSKRKLAPLGSGRLAESPFHPCGYIGRQHTTAWKAMKWHDEIIFKVLKDLDRVPPEYVLIRAPVLGGKTTFAMQFMDYVVQNRPDILIVYLPLAGFTRRVEEFNLLHLVHKAFTIHLGELLDAAYLDVKQRHSLRETLDRWMTLKATELHDLLCEMVSTLPTFFRRVVLLIDDCELLPPEQREMGAEAFRAIHTERVAGPLKRFSILVLAHSLQRSPRIESPLANVVVDYFLNDFTEDEVQAFLCRCGELRQEMIFEPAAVRYLYRKVGGQTVMIQRICEAIDKRKTPPTRVKKADVLEGIIECYEKGGGAIGKLLDLSELTDDALLVLNSVLREVPVLPFECQPAVAQLMDLGIVKQGNNNRCICRSPLLRELLIARYFDPTALTLLTSFEERLATLPQVIALLCSDTLLEQVKDAIKDQNSMGFRSSGKNAEDIVMEVLRRQKLDVDLAEIRYFFRHYYKDAKSVEVDKDRILRLVAKVYIGWCM